MFDEELSSFLTKFHQLKRAGLTAHLDLDTYAGRAWVGLRVMLGPDHHQNVPSQRKRSPSYFRRQERRKAARAAEEPILGTGDVAEEASDNTKSKDVTATEEVTNKSTAAVVTFEESSEAKVDNCELCDFKTDRKNGLIIHMRRKHAKMEQLDGNDSFEDESDDDYEINNFYEEIECYLKTGEIKWKHSDPDWGNIKLFEKVLKEIDANFYNNKSKRKEMLDQAMDARKKALQYKFGDGVLLGIYPINYTSLNIGT